MGPILNPVYWIFGFIILGITSILSLIGGFLYYIRVTEKGNGKHQDSNSPGEPIAENGFETQEEHAKSFRLLNIGKTILVIGVLWFGIFFCLCNLTFGDLHKPLIRPADENIFGTWNLTSSSQNYLEKEFGYEFEGIQPAFIFNRDGTFEMIKMPDIWLSFSYSPEGGFESGVGAWEISKQQNHWGISFDYETITEHPDDLHTFLRIKRYKSIKFIEIPLDPDAGRFLYLSRVTEVE